MAASDRTARPKAAFVYMVRCTGGQLYTGWTNDPAARLRAHRSGKGARYTRAHGAEGFAYLERCADRCAALRREAALKKLPKAQKTVVYGIAIAGGLGTYLLLGQLMGGGMGMPRFEAAQVGNLELVWLIPLALIGTVCGWLYFVSEHASEALAHTIGERPVVKAMLAGLALAICGTVLPYTMFAGETQADVLMETYLTIPAGVLIATGLVKAMLTPALINLGWRGGHFFPVIFSGVSLGYGLAILTGADPVFYVAVCTASTMGAVMRQPVMVVGLLLMCFPLKGIVCMIIAAVIAAGIPLPKPLRK